MRSLWDKLFWYFLIALSAFVLYQLIRNILGGSWGFEALFATLLVINLGLSIGNLKQIFTLKGEFRGFKGEFRGFKRSMYTLEEDFKDFKKETQQNFSKVDKRLDKIEHILQDIQKIL